MKIVRAFIGASITRIDGTSASLPAAYGMVIAHSDKNDEYWGTKCETDAMTMKMHAVYRLLQAVSLHDEPLIVNVFTQGAYLEQRFGIASTRKRNLQHGKKQQPLHEQDLWIETAILWDLHSKGLREAITEEEKRLLSIAESLALTKRGKFSFGDRIKMPFELVEDDRPIRLE